MSSFGRKIVSSWDDYKYYVRGLVVLYAAFAFAAFITVIISVVVYWVLPETNSGALALKVNALTSVGGPLALTAVWLLAVTFFVWSRHTRWIIKYYGDRLIEVIITLLASLCGAVIAFGLLGYGWESFYPIITHTLIAVLLMLLIRFETAVDDGIQYRVMAAFIAFCTFCAIMFTTAFWQE